MILTENLILVPLSQFSIPDRGQTKQFVAWLNDPLVVRYSEHRHYEHTPESQLNYWNKVISEPRRYWFIRLKGQEGGKPATIGSIEARFDEFNLTSNIGMMIGDRTCWGKGYGKEAFAAVIENERLHTAQKVEAGMMATNEPMRRTCLACGMREEAVIEGHFLAGTDRISLILMGMML